MIRSIPLPLALLLGATLVFGETPKPVVHAATAPQFEKLAKEAAAAREAGHIDDALALYKKAVAIKPAWDEGWYFIGSLNYSQEKYEEGRDAFKHFAALKPEAPGGWGMLGLCEFETRQYDNALKHLNHAINLGIGAEQEVSDVVHYHYAILLTRNAKYEQSMRNLAMFAQRNLEAPAYVEAMGIAALRKPLLPSEVPPGERELIMDTGRTMYDASALKTAQAGAEFKALVDKYPNTPNIHYLYGSFLLFSDVNEGLEELKRELEISPAHVAAMVTLASEYLRTQDFASARPYAEQAVNTDGHDFAAHAVLGRILAEGGIDLPRGIKELEVARNLEPDSPQVRLGLASAYAKAGRKEDAARERAEFLKMRKLADAANQSVP